MKRLLKVAAAIMFISNSVLQAQNGTEPLPDVWKRFEEFIGATDVLVNNGNMRYAIVCEDDDNFCWILTPRVPLSGDEVDTINILINKDPGEATGRMGVIDGADYRIVVNLKEGSALVEQYDNIAVDVPLAEYGKYILKTQVSPEAWKTVIQDGYIALIIEKRWLESLSLSGPSQYYALVYSGDQVVSAGVFSSDQAANARGNNKEK